MVIKAWVWALGPQAVLSGVWVHEAPGWVVDSGL